MVYRDLTQPSYSEDFYGASLAKIDGTAYCRFAKIDFREGRALVSEIYSALPSLSSLSFYISTFSFYRFRRKTGACLSSQERRTKADERCGNN